MKNRIYSCYRIGRIPVLLLLILLAPFAAFAEEGCRTGASALGNAYVRANTLYAHFYGDIESYVAEHREHFVAGGDSIRCAQALSQALMSGAMRRYNPDDLRRKRELDARMGAMGISPGPSQPSASQQLYGMSLQLSRLARVLPPAVNGNYQPLRTPANQLEQQQMFATQLLVMLLQDPEMAGVLQQVEPIIKDAVNLEFQILIGMAKGLVR
jgi:hypothetical protein